MLLHTGTANFWSLPHATMDNNDINEYPVDAAALDELSHGMVSDGTYMYYEYTAFALSLVI